jgi:hypothetical protein
MATEQEAPIESGYKFILAYGIVIMLVIFLMKYKAGYVFVYNILVLALLLLLVTQSKFITESLKPITNGV